MKKALKAKISGTKKLVRRVLSKPSISSHESIQSREAQMAEEELLKNELEALKDQIINLKAAINALQNDTENKDICIANLAREKEKISLELLKTKRSNSNLEQQLEDERKFYYKEKEMYCQEMNECKKIKKMLSSSRISNEDKDVEDYKNELVKLKQTLNNTLEANYNLSIKFLRMKNTKTCLKTELQAMRLEHEKLENDYKTKIENLTTELNELVNRKLSAQISPSSKKYLQLVKQNSCLVYENMCLQLEVDNMKLKFEKFKLERTRSETNSRLKYIHHREDQLERRKVKKEKKVRIQEDELPEKLDKVTQPSCSYSCPTHSTSLPKENIVKIFERKQTTGIPTIKIVNEKRIKEKKSRKKREQKSCISEASKAKCQESSKYSVADDFQIKIEDSCRENIASKDLAKLALFQVSDIQSVVSSDNISTVPKISRSRSSPEIMQSSTFLKSTC